MTTLSDVASNVADMLRGRTDLSSQIKDEIRHAIRHYSRRVNWLTELRNGTLSTVAGTTWYGTVDNSSSVGFSDGLTGTAPTSTDSVADLLQIIYAKLEQGSTDWPLDLVPYREFERLLENTSVQGIPRYITRFADQIGLWPTPGAVYTLYLAAQWKPILPTADTHESAWFDHYLELIEASAARRMAQKWLHDMELVGLFAATEAEQEKLLLAEGAARNTTGKLRPHAI